MKIVTASLAALWLCLSFALPAHSAEEFRGHWTLSPSRERGKVQFGLTLRNAGDGMSQARIGLAHHRRSTCSTMSPAASMK